MDSTNCNESIPKNQFLACGSFNSRMADAFVLLQKTRRTQQPNLEAPVDHSLPSCRKSEQGLHHTKNNSQQPNQTLIPPLTKRTKKDENGFEPERNAGKNDSSDSTRPFQCDICQKSYRSKWNILSHMRIHRAENRRYACSVCPRAFFYATDLRKHMKCHSLERPIICDICGDAFKSADTLKAHMRRHTGERPHKCMRCPRAFSTSNSLYIHTRTHTGERPFSCEFCKKGFSDASTLLVHKRLHTNENPYICHLCGRRTKQASNLRSHYKHFHKNNDITGRQIRLNSRILARFPQFEIDDQLAKVGDLMALLEKGLQEYQQEEIEKNEKIQKSLEIMKQPQRKPVTESNKISSQHQIRQQHHPTRSKSSLEDGIRPKITHILDNDPTKIENEHPRIVDVKIEIDEPSLLQISTRPKRRNATNLSVPESEPKRDVEIKLTEDIMTIGMTSIRSLRRKRNKTFTSIPPIVMKEEPDFEDIIESDQKMSLDQLSVPIAQPKIESIFIEDGNEVENGSIKKEEFSDDDNWFFDIDDSFRESPLMSDIKTQTKDGNEQSCTKLEQTKKNEMEKCNKCSRKFHNLRRHKIEIHSDIERPFECFVCHRNYKRFDQLRCHFKTHGDRRDYICHFCGERFFLSNDMRKHIINRHQTARPYKCPNHLCSKVFKSAHALKVHSRTHSSMKPYVCSMCPESFAAIGSLKTHERSRHTGEKPYVCSYCNKAFSDSSTHRQHTRIHTGEKPYRCHLCDRRTAQAGNLKSHYRHYHKLIVRNVSMYDHGSVSAIPPIEE